MKLFHKPRFLWLGGIFLLWLAIHYWDGLVSACGIAFSAAHPIVVGCEIAYVVNILMDLIERNFAPNSRKKWVRTCRRPVCLLLSYLGLLALVALLVWMILPEFVHCIELLTQQLPDLFAALTEKVKSWSLTRLSDSAQFQAALKHAEESLQTWFKAILGGVGDGAAWLLDRLTGLISGISTLALGIAFSIYLLAGKEKLARQFTRLFRAFLPQKVRTIGHYILSTTNQCFRNYIVGQCVEAVVLGTLCALGMMILRLPYAPMVGCVVGVTALIPILGAYIGAGIGAIMIFTTSPMQALVFIIFLVLLQQLEGNLIYPRIVGSSLGLPGLWVLAAVTVGGSLYGIPGMIIGVPITATAYMLLKAAVRKRGERELISR